jgi:hypothetical protein
MSAVPAVWRRSTGCVNDLHCVEVAELGDDEIGLRSSIRPDLTLAVSRQAWREFADGLKAGEFTLE